MYNSDRKESFLNSLTTWRTPQFFLPIFNDSERMEEELSKDLADFNKKELIEFMNSRLTSNVQTAKKDINNILFYQAHFHPSLDKDFIAKEDLDFCSAIRREIYLSPDEIITDLSRFGTFGDGYFIFPAFCLAWLGFTQKEASLLLREDVDLIEGLIKTKEKKIKIPDSILEKFREYQNTTTAYRTQNFTFEVYAQNSPYFLRRMVTKNSKKKITPIPLASLVSEANKLKILDEENHGYSKFVYTYIYKSGQLRRVYELEKSGLDVTATSNQSTVHAAFDNKGDFYDYLYLYKKYKEAFDLN